MNQQQLSPFSIYLEDVLSYIRDTYQVSIDYIYNHQVAAYIVRINDSVLWEEEDFQDYLTDVVYESIDLAHSRNILFVSPTDKRADFDPTHSLSVKRTSISPEGENLTLKDYNYYDKTIIFTKKVTPFCAADGMFEQNTPYFNTKRDSNKDNSPAVAI